MHPQDAYRCFMRTEMDVVMQNQILFKKAPKNEENEDWKQKFELD